MFLRDVIRKEVIDYLKSEHWKNFMEVMNRGLTVRHAHIHLESILHPISIEKIIYAYFDSKNIKYKKKRNLLSHGKGHTNVYYIQPENMCHFELLIQYNQNVVIKPMRAEATRQGESIEYWDDEYMKKYYKGFNFREMEEKEKKEVEKYFQSDAWKQAYGAMFYGNNRNVHSHCVVETSLHPEDILPIGESAIKNKGWDIDRTVSVVFGCNGFDTGKITYLLSNPRIVLELEWDFNPNVIIEPGIEPITRITNEKMVRKDMEDVDYIELNEDDINWVKEKL